MIVSCMNCKCLFHLCQRNKDQQRLQSVSSVSLTQKINLEKAESSVANLISKLKIRQDDVYQRLSPDLDLLYENEVLWHAPCYATYTSVQNTCIKYASSKASRVVETADTNDMSTEPSPRVSRSSVAPQDWSKCMFCKKITHKKEKTMQTFHKRGRQKHKAMCRSKR